MKDMQNMDSLLKAALAPNENADELLNIKLKAAIRKKAENKHCLSIWWVPMVASFIISLGAIVLVNLYVINPIIGFIINSFIITNTVINIIITFIGVKFFNLKKGAEIKL